MTSGSVSYTHLQERERARSSVEIASDPAERREVALASQARRACQVSDGRPISEWPPDLPLVPERVDDPAEPPAVLVADGGELPGTLTHRLCQHRAWILDDQENRCV